MVHHYREFGQLEYFDMCTQRKKSVPIKLSTKSVMHEIIINYLSMIHCLKLNWLTSVINGVLIGPCTLTLDAVTVTHSASELSIYSLALRPRFNFSVKMVFHQTERQLVPSCSLRCSGLCRCGYWMIDQLLVWRISPVYCQTGWISEKYHLVVSD